MLREVSAAITNRSATVQIVELDELYWFLEYKPQTETRENVYIMTMVIR